MVVFRVHYSFLDVANGTGKVSNILFLVVPIVALRMHLVPAVAERAPSGSATSGSLRISVWGSDLSLIECEAEQGYVTSSQCYVPFSEKLFLLGPIYLPD